MKEIIEHLQYLELEELILIKAKVNNKQKQAEFLEKLWIRK